jgi:hypothetical protein
MKKTWREKLGLQPRSKREVFTVDDPLILVDERPVQTICDTFDLCPEAQSLCKDQPAADVFLTRLVEAEHTMDAVRFLAHALPEQEAIHWACCCVEQVPDCREDANAREALTRAQAWVQGPCEMMQHQAARFYPQLNFEMPGAPSAWIIMAVAWSTAMDTEAEEPMALPPPCSTAYAAASAIILAATAQKELATERYRAFLDRGVAIAQGKEPLPRNTES